MPTNCTYRLGEFEKEEFLDNEFFTGYLDCSVSDSLVKCDNLFTHAKPFIRSQRESDYKLLWDYVFKDLQASILSITSKAEIGVDDSLGIEFNLHTTYLISMLLLFKEQLKAKKDAVDELDSSPEVKAQLMVDIYTSLFNAYKLSCVNTNFKGRYKRPKYVKDMLRILNVKEYVSLALITYQVNTDYNNDPIYYIADLS